MTRFLDTTCRATALTAALILTPALDAAVETPPSAAALVVDRALPEVDPSQADDGRALFESVLASELFVSGSVGPFDVHVLADSGRRARRDADELLEAVLETLEPAGELVARLWPEGGEGLVSAARLPLVICDGEVDGVGYGELLALLDHCESLGYSGWAPANAVDTPHARQAEVMRTWDVQLFDMQHATIDDRRSRFVEHGIGYYSLAFVANRALRRGAWGMVPPWLANGLIDELDIAAYGEAWVGQESWTRQTAGWYRAGWSGFVPQGHQPPAPITGPPADLATTVVKTGDPWLSFDASTSRHWSSLLADRDSDAPASFARAAQTESFLPRDRAAARCLLHLMLQGDDDAGDGRALFTALLDSEVGSKIDGMPDSEPLPVLFAAALGGVPAVDRLESISTRELLVELERADLVERLEALGAGAALELSDHREQSLWLARRMGFSGADRGEIFNAFLEIEWLQQMAEWRAMGPHLDAGLAAALESSKRYPKREKDLAKVVAAFREGVARDPATIEADESQGKSKSKSKGKSKSRSRSRRR